MLNINGISIRAKVLTNGEIILNDFSKAVYTDKSNNIELIYLNDTDLLIIQLIKFLLYETTNRNPINLIIWYTPYNIKNDLLTFELICNIINYMNFDNIFILLKN